MRTVQLRLILCIPLGLALSSGLWLLHSVTCAASAQMTYKGKEISGNFHRAISLRRRADALLKQDKNEEACPLLEQAVGLAPEFVEAQAELGSVLLKLEQPAKAIPHLQAAVDDNIDNEATWLNLGAAFRVNGQNDDAALIYQCFLKRFPGSVKKQNVINLEQAARAMQSDPDSQSLWSSAKTADSLDVSKRHSEGVAAIGSGNYVRAIDAFYAIVKARPDLNSARVNLALALSGEALLLEKQKKYEDAETAYKQVVDLRKSVSNPEILDSSLRNYAAMLRDLGRPAEAASVEKQTGEPLR